LPATLAAVVEPKRLQALAERAARLGGADPLNAILARIDALLSRKT
jgi:protoheme ferro-lyase